MIGNGKFASNTLHSNNSGYKKNESEDFHCICTHTLMQQEVGKE